MSRGKRKKFVVLSNHGGKEYRRDLIRDMGHCRELLYKYQAVRVVIPYPKLETRLTISKLTLADLESMPTRAIGVDDKGQPVTFIEVATEQDQCLTQDSVTA